MEYLMDTHIVLWWLTTPEKINAKVRKMIRDDSNIVFVSAASFWEMAIKQSIGRLSLPHNLIESIASQNFKLLPILPEEALGVADLPQNHTDPFDRLLVIQAKLNNLVMITADKMIKSYPIVILEA